MPVDLTPGSVDPKSMFFDMYQGDVVEETPVDPAIETPTSDDPQPKDDNNQEDSVDTDNSDDEEYEIVEVDEDELEDGDEVIDEDLNEDEDPEVSKAGKDKAEEGTGVSAYLYHDETEGREIFLKAIDPVTGEGSVYLDRDEAERGLANQVAFIGELKQQVQETREASSAKVAELEKELILLRGGSNPEIAKENLVKAELPERFKNVDPANLADEDLRLYKNARLDAEIKVEREIRTQVETAERQRLDHENAEDRAKQHIRSRMTDLKFFGMKKVEDQRQIKTTLNEKPEGSDYNYSDIITSVAKAYGNEVADQMLLAIVGGNPQKSNDSETPTTPKPKTSKKPKAEQVEKVKKKVRRKKVAPVNQTPATPDISSMSARDIANASFAAGKNKRQRL